MSADPSNSSRDSREQPHLDLRVLTMIGILVIMWLLFRWKVGAFYFGGESIAKLSRDMATWTILAAGMTLVIVSGNIDLSVGSLLALVAATCALLMNREYGAGWSTMPAVAVALVVGLVAGTLQGALVAWCRMPAFIVTLAGLFIFRGLTQKVSAHDPRVPDGSWVLNFGSRFVPPTGSWTVAVVCCVALAGLVAYGRWRKRRLDLPLESRTVSALKVIVPAIVILGFVYKVNYWRAGGQAIPKGIPLQTLTMAVVLLLIHFIAQHTRFGRHVFAIGGNVQAARLSGINVERTTVSVFALMGLLTGVAGVLWMAQNEGSTQKAGEWYELQAIAACVIGGTSLMGGRGSVFGTFLGALVMATVVQGMDYTYLSNWLQLVVRGGVLALAVAIDVATKDPAPWMVRLRDAIKHCAIPKDRKDRGH